ncbi:MAG: hypothetical protein WAO98_05820 [Alphaproteobacteria bacterium]
MMYDSFKDRAVSTLTLFSTFSTLFCCALPALLVALGAGSVMAGLMSTGPQLAVISEHKAAVFIFAGLMLSLSAFTQWSNRNAACPIDPAKARACTRLKKISRIIFGISLTAYLTGIFFAYFAKYFVQ